MLTALVLDRSIASQYLGYACGVAFCVACHAFTALGIVTQKSVLKASTNGCLYYTQPLWIAGLVLIIVGQLLNLPALAFVPQTVVSVLGGLSIVFSSALAPAVLGERLGKDQVLAMAVMILS
eukprot:Skav213828  [mRNA]  locus=scaffold1987:721293:722305:+ [translate_table: standard]